MEEHIIDLKKVFQTLWAKRKVFYWVWPITFVLSAALIVCVPRKYQSTVVLAPESNSEGMLGGSLGGLASSFGFNLGSLGSSDAIYPTIYPDLVASPDFLVPLFNTHVTSADGQIDTRYYDYLLKMQKHPFWWYPKAWIGKIIKQMKGEGVGGRPAGTSANNGKEFDLFWLNKIQRGVLSAMQANIKCDVDKQTDIITIVVKDQDPLIAACMADTVSQALQDFVTEYRTKKARTDADYYQKMVDEAYEAYQQAQWAYTAYADSHIGTTQERYRAELSRLGNVMNQKQDIYNTFQQQYIAATAKLQERTPIYTIIQSASVAERASSPKRMLFVIGMLILVTIITSLWLTRKELLGL